MTIENNAIVPGAAAVPGSCGSAGSQWRLEPLAEGSLRILNRESKLSLNRAHCGLAEGTELSQAPWADNDCQKFQLRRIPARG